MNLSPTIHFIRQRVLFVANIALLLLVSYGFDLLDKWHLELFRNEALDYSLSALILIHLIRICLVALWCVGCFFSVKFLVEMQFTRFMRRLEIQVLNSEKAGWEWVEPKRSFLFPAPTELKGLVATLKKETSPEQGTEHDRMMDAIKSRDLAALKSLAKEIREHKG